METPTDILNVPECCSPIADPAAQGSLADLLFQPALFSGNTLLDQEHPPHVLPRAFGPLYLGGHNGNLNTINYFTSVPLGGVEMNTAVSGNLKWFRRVLVMSGG